MSDKKINQKRIDALNSGDDIELSPKTAKQMEESGLKMAEKLKKSTKSRNAEKKVTLTLRLKPRDAMRIIQELKDRDMITDKVYITKMDVLLEPIFGKLIAKTADKDS